MPSSDDPEETIQSGRSFPVFFHETDPAGKIMRIAGNLSVRGQAIFMRCGQREDAFRLDDVLSVGYETSLNHNYARCGDLSKCFNVVFRSALPCFLEALEMDELADLVLGLSRLCRKANPSSVAYVTKAEQFQRILQLRLTKMHAEKLGSEENRMPLKFSSRRGTVS